MTTPNLEMEILALALIGESDRPVGSSRLAEAFNEAGIQVAEATAGRFLRSLDNRGLTMIPRTKQGRIVTELGQRRLEELRAERRLEQRGANLVRAASTADLNELLDILIVRRAVEAEGARLAAVNAGAEELEDILSQAEAHQATVAAGGTPDADSSTRFHRSVATASHNRMLASIAHLLIEPSNPNLTKVLEEVSLNTEAVAAQSDDHSALAQALTQRDSERAGELLHEHISHLITAVRAYLERNPNGTAQ